MMIQVGGGSAATSPRICSRNVRELAKKSGASKRKTTDGEQFRLGEAAEVVVAGKAVDASEHRLVGPPRTPERDRDRYRRCDRDAVEHAEQDDPKEGGGRDGDLRSALPPEPHRPREVGE